MPLFISNRTLQGRKSLPRALGPWALDSGGFSELSLYGAWQTTAAQYVAAVRRYRDEIGNLQWAAIRDWMTEPHMLARTGLTVAEHQQRTVASYLDLRQMAPELPWTPVLQGWTVDDYLRCVELYERAGVTLQALPLVGVGSVCRRQGTETAARIFGSLHGLGLRLHGFGVKTLGLRKFAGFLASSDSMAWSFNARKRPNLCGSPAHRNCANCLVAALRWRLETLRTVERAPCSWQLGLGLAA